MLRCLFGVLGKCCLLLLAVWLLVNGAFAQMETATISGQVLDPTGLRITGVQVKLVDIDRDTTTDTATNPSGLYTFPSVRPGRYRMEVRAPGFKVVNVTGITINVQEHLEQNFKLAVGSVSESVTVEGGAALVNTESAAVSTVIDRKFVENMPLNGRSFQDLILLTPGIVTQSPQANTSIGNNGDFSVNGQRTESNYYTVDGVAANTSAGAGLGFPQAANGGTIPATTALGTTQSLVSVDALQEFRVQSSSYSAEYGRNPGGQFSFVTRSGTNELHGTGFDYLRNNFFDANDWFNDHFGKPITPLRQNAFGGTLGGPVVIPNLYNGRDKTFFFVSYEGLRLTQPQAATIQYVPDAFMRQEAVAAVQPILNAFPLPTPGGVDYGTAGSPNLAQFIAPYSLPSLIDSASIRVDHRFGSWLALFFRFGDTQSFTTTRSLSALSKQRANNRTYTFGATSLLSSRVSNEFRLGHTSSASINQATLDAFGGATPTNLPAAMGANFGPSSQGQLFIIFQGIGEADLTTGKGQLQGKQWNAVDTISYSLGQHQLRIGLDYRRITSPLTPTSPTTLAAFFDPQSLLTGTTFAVFVGKEVAATPVFNETAIFAEDEWKITPRLTLSSGLRWEVDPPPTEANGNDAFTVLGNINNPSTLTLAPGGTPLWKTSWYNFAPRLGLAWQPFNNKTGWETVIRTGGGVFFDTANQQATQGFGGVGFSASNNLFGQALPVPSSAYDFNPSTSPPYTGTQVVAFPPHLQLPYTLQWNAAVEQGVGKQQTITASYVGASGRRLLQFQTRFVESLNPNFNEVQVEQGGVTSSYDALQLRFQRSVSHGIHALASYSWSHCIDFGSSNALTAATRGNCDFDVRHNFQGALSWDLPAVQKGRFGSQILSGWGLDSRIMARTSFPVTIVGNALVDPVTGLQYSGNADLVPGQPIYIYGSQYPGSRAVNPAAFIVPTDPNDPGNAPRNFVRGFGAVQIDLAARRDFHIYENLRLQFRTEAFNVLNHPNFGLIDSALADATFGQATAMLNQSLGTLSPQYQQGGPRSMQFALKLIF